MYIKLKKGLDIPINGKPSQTIEPGAPPLDVALLGEDYPGLKPNVMVSPGERVKQGQALFSDRRTGVSYVTPCSGVVREINRGARRKLKSIIVRTDGDDAVSYRSYERAELQRLAAEDIRRLLLESGLWTSFRTRPFNKTPDPATSPYSLFINAMDTRPLAADPDVVIDTHAEDFFDGVMILCRLFDVDIYLCHSHGSKLPLPEAVNIRPVEFSGPHPAGLVGTHIHFLCPAGKNRTVWHLDYQDVIAIGNTFRNGRLYTSRVIALCGPAISRPRLLTVTSGSALAEIVRDNLNEGRHRLISGSVLCGRNGDPQTSYLGRYHLQVSVLDEYSPQASGDPPGGRFSLHGLLPAWIRAGGNHYNFDTALNGRPGPFMPLGTYERVMPLDLLPSPLLRGLLAGDFDTAMALGCLELAEEDLALCEFVSSGKQDYSGPLRSCLDALDGAVG